MAATDVVIDGALLTTIAGVVDDDDAALAVALTTLLSAGRESAETARLDVDDAIDVGAAGVDGVAAVLLAESNGSADDDDDDDDDVSANSALISARNASVSACSDSLSILFQRSVNAKTPMFEIFRRLHTKLRSLKKPAASNAGCVPGFVESTRSSF